MSQVKAYYTGSFRDGTSVCYRGVTFSKGEAREVSEAFFDANQDRLKKTKPKSKAKAVTDGDESGT